MEGFKKLWDMILIKQALSSFPKRSFNHDLLEFFFFWQIRQQGVRHINPRCATFNPYFNALLVRNFRLPHSRKGNCESDNCENLVNNFASLFKHTNKAVEKTPSTIQILGISEPLERLEETALYNLSNRITRAIRSYFKNCETGCKNTDKIPYVLLQLCISVSLPGLLVNDKWSFLWHSRSIYVGTFPISRARSVLVASGHLLWALGLESPVIRLLTKSV